MQLEIQNFDGEIRDQNDLKDVYQATVRDDQRGKWQAPEEAFSSNN